MNPTKSFIKSLVGSDLKNVWVSGKIEQTVGTDILIISDGTAKAKITNCNSAHQQINISWICKGSPCCVIGSLLKNNSLPEIRADKVIHITDDMIYQELWELEVKESQLFLSGMIEPDLNLSL